MPCERCNTWRMIMLIVMFALALISVTTLAMNYIENSTDINAMDNLTKQCNMKIQECNVKLASCGKLGVTSPSGSEVGGGDGPIPKLNITWN